MTVPAASIDSSPRLAYIGEVPPLNLSAGPAVLYRLFRCYPPARLLVCDDASARRYEGFELPGVKRRLLHYTWPRLMSSRFGRWHGALALIAAPPLLTRRLVRELRAFRAEAVISIAHGATWWTAYRAAWVAGVPYHLIVHDHWRDCLSIPSWADTVARRRFAIAYRGARSRLLISPAMARRYASEYGGDHVLLPPAQPPDADVFAAPPERPRAEARPFVFAYAGSTGGAWVRRAIVQLAHAVDSRKARVRVYQHMTLAPLQAAGLRTANVDLVPFMAARDLHRDLRANAHAMFLPMSFDPADRTNVEVCFPSKLTDYTVPGLPILIFAPPCGSAVEWARQNSGAAVVVAEDNSGELERAAARLMDDPESWQLLGAAALEAGRRCFAAPRVQELLLSALRSPAASPAAATASIHDGPP